MKLSKKINFSLITTLVLFIGCTSQYAFTFDEEEAKLNEKPLYRAAIIDRFFPPSEPFLNAKDKESHTWMYGLVDVDRDRVKEPYYHGDIVQIIAASPQIAFTRYPIEGKQKPMKEILTNLRVILARMPTLPVDSLVLSWESSTLISAFPTPFEKRYSERYIQVLKAWGKNDEIWSDTYQVIRALEALTEQGVKVFTIAGNSGARTVNTLSFAKGVTTVGAKEPELSYFITNNVFVDVYEQAAYEIKRIDNQIGQTVGYDINDDGCEDIPLALISRTKQTTLPAKVWPPIKGSSFAAPLAMKKALLNLQDNQEIVCPTL
ncbi:hypothetical protein GV054_10045 [Marinomonas mediterranea]|uniref:hypothetical protein n=1 Tax=Marinomonas mediterranea TaxID=119864 RepID=UPI00234BB3C8|nr:hypothetical protein [Marinomonas mediterranea]WCN13323.1 hypothetical protein GV054_10045 [Marinomonas mediterranea]